MANLPDLANSFRRNYIILHDMVISPFVGRSPACLSRPMTSFWGINHCTFRFGRKPVLAITLILQVILGVCVSFSPNYIAFTILRFMLGAVNIGVLTTAFVLGTYVFCHIYSNRGTRIQDQNFEGAPLQKKKKKKKKNPGPIYYWYCRQSMIMILHPVQLLMWVHSISMISRCSSKGHKLYFWPFDFVPTTGLRKKLTSLVQSSSLNILRYW